MSSSSAVVLGVHVETNASLMAWELRFSSLAYLVLRDSLVRSVDGASVSCT
jgi:hypothetical protein